MQSFRFGFGYAATRFVFNVALEINNVTKLSIELDQIQLGSTQLSSASFVSYMRKINYTEGFGGWACKYVL